MSKLKNDNKPTDQGSFDISLEGAKYGEVVTRFPPEPSGYLHIGHAKAVLLNQYFAQLYGGKLIVRFDDTNPTKENMEYEGAIMEDLDLLSVKGDKLSHTSDYFDELIHYAFKLIDLGLAYCDDTPQEMMRKTRFDGIASLRRDTSIEENRKIFQDMVNGKMETQSYCLRAKMSINATNKALRDPVIYRCQMDVPHHRTGSQYKVYPTYDFACPIVDSIEGVTHALRTLEYHDRNDQYYWFISSLSLRKPFIWDYSRLNFVYTLLSKRKLNWFVTNGKVEGWSDPRFPTIRGILRRGLTLNALKKYILMQGASKNTLLLEWDKLWALNKKEIDPIAPRYTALARDSLVHVTITDGPKEKTLQSTLLHKKNPALGSKDFIYYKDIYLCHDDVLAMNEGEEVTLMNWGNVIVSKIQKNDTKITNVELKMHLEGDFKLTKLKLTWLSNTEDLISVRLHDYDFLITKKKLEEEDTLENFLTSQTEFITEAKGEAALKALKKGDIIQLERSGYYICDIPWTETKPILKLILIPDGRAKSTGSKSDISLIKSSLSSLSVN